MKNSFFALSLKKKVMEIIDYFIRGFLISVFVMFSAATLILTLELLNNHFDFDNKSNKLYWGIVITLIIIIGSIFSK